MSKHRKASGPKPPDGKKQKTNGKKELKEKTVAAEIGAAVMREEAPKPSPAPVPRPVAPPAAPAAAKEVAKDKAPEPPPATAKDRAKTPTSAVAKEKVPEPPLRLLDTTVDTFERSFQAVGQGTIAVNRKLLDFARDNVSSGFDFAMSLASASSPAQIMQLQMDYWDQRLKALVSQAQELRALSADLVAKTSEPIRQRMRASRGNAA